MLGNGNSLKIHSIHRRFKYVANRGKCRRWESVWKKPRTPGGGGSRSRKQSLKKVTANRDLNYRRF